MGRHASSSSSFGLVVILALALAVIAPVQAAEPAPPPSPPPATDVQGLVVGPPDPKTIQPCKGDDDACIERLVRLAKLYAPKQVKTMCARMASNRMADRMMRQQFTIGDPAVALTITPNPLEQRLCTHDR